MKDPLDQTAAPYEVLGLREDATADDVEAAFRGAPRKGADVPRLTRAWQALKNPAERAFLDLLRYDDGALAAHAPSPLEDPGLLRPPRRGATAAAWEAHLRENFPDDQMAHSLAVLWYWWAVAESDRGRNGHPAGVEAMIWDSSAAPDDAPDACTLWERAAAYWAMLIAHPGFWEGRPRVDSDLAGRLAERVEHTISQRLDDIATVLQKSGATDEAQRYRTLELAFASEVRTARFLAARGFSAGGVPVAAGPLLLARLGLRERVTRALTAAVTRNPDDADLRAARDALSPYGEIAALIAEGRPGEALERIGRLSRRSRSTDTVASLEARALAALGASEADLGKVEDAVGHFAQAMEVARRPEDRAAAREAIVAATRQRVATLTGKNDDAAIALLERAHEVSGDDCLGATLAELLTRRAVRTINAAQTGPGEPSPRALERALSAGVRDLERAEALGSALAAEQLVVARAMHEQIGSLGDVEIAARSANQAAERGDWDGAVASLRKAVTAAGPHPPEPLRRNLAVALANRGTARANATVERFQELQRRAGPPDIAGALATVKGSYRSDKRDQPKERTKPHLVTAVLALALSWLWLFIASASEGTADDPVVQGVVGGIERLTSRSVDLATAGGRTIFAAVVIGAAGALLAVTAGVAARLQTGRAEGRRHRFLRGVVTIVVLVALGATWWWLFENVEPNPRFAWMAETWGRIVATTGILALVVLAVAGIQYVIFLIYQGLTWLFGAIHAKLEELMVPPLPQYGGSVDHCAVCGGSASYTVRLAPGSGTADLCSTHAHEVERVAQRSFLTWESSVELAKMLTAARSDVAEAAALAPDLADVTKGLRQIDALTTDMLGGDEVAKILARQ